MPPATGRRSGSSAPRGRGRHAHRGLVLKVSSIALLALLPLVAGAYRDAPEVREFVHDLVTSEGFSEQELARVFADAVYQQSIIDAMQRAPERTLEWREYKRIFLTDARIRDGAKFWRDHSAALARAEKEYGVPASIVVSIIGVETLYGQRMGSYRVIDSLATLAFDYPPRGRFFRNELKEFLLLAREEHRDVHDLKGSYAGAMGFGQFIPSSYRAFAVDFDHDGVRDIWFNATDAIGSVANYLSQHGWRRGEPVTCPVTPPPVAEGIHPPQQVRPQTPLGEWVGRGYAPLGDFDHALTAQPFLLNGDDGPEYWMSFTNFYAITRYNHSELYAMAVYQLSRQITGRADATTRASADPVTDPRSPQ